MLLAMLAIVLAFGEPEPMGIAQGSVSLRTYVDMRFEAEGRSNDQRFGAIRDAVSKAEASTDRRMEAMNEFRAAMSDREKNFARKDEVDTQARRLDALEARVNVNQGRDSGVNAAWVAGIAAASVVIGGAAVGLAARRKP